MTELPLDTLVAELVAAMRPVMPAARKLISRTTNRPVPESLASRLRIGEERFSLGMLQPLPVTEALRNVAIYMRAGIEHMQGVVSMLRGPLDIGTSIATLARGSAEAHGRALFFIARPDVHSLLAGFLRVQISSEKYLRQQMSGNADWLTASSKRIQAYEATAGLLAFRQPEIAYINPSAHAVAMMNAITPKGHKPQGQFYYSMLSSKAHHELSGFASQRIGAKRGLSGMPFDPIFGLHPETLAATIGPLVLGHMHVMELFLDLHSVDAEHRQVWGQAATALLRLLEEFEKFENPYADFKVPEGIEFPSAYAREIDYEAMWAAYEETDGSL